MIDKKISVSEDVASLPIEAQLLFTWMIPHADDVGLLPHSARAIKALVIPMLDMTMEDVGFHLESIQKVGLIELFEWKGDKFWRIKNFNEHQILKKDRQPQTLLKIRQSSHPADNWKYLESIWNPDGTQRVPEGREGSKGIEEKEVRKEEGYKKFLKAKQQIGKPV